MYPGLVPSLIHLAWNGLHGAAYAFVAVILPPCKIVLIIYYPRHCNSMIDDVDVAGYDDGDYGDDAG